MRITIKGIDIHYTVSGEGRDLVLLHGWGGSIASFAPVHQHYQQYFRTYSLDWPGFGKSNEPDEPWGVEDYAEMFCEWMRALKIQNPIVMAHSFGGRVVIYSAGKMKYNFHKIILIDSAGIKPKRSLKYYLKVYIYKLIKKLVYLPGCKQLLLKKFEQYRKRAGSSDYRNASENMKKVFIKVVNQDLKKYLSYIHMPTLLIWGGNDTATPLGDAQIMEKLIPDAGLVVFKNAGHFSYLEEFNRFICVADNFLKKDMGVSNV